MQHTFSWFALQIAIYARFSHGVNSFGRRMKKAPKGAFFMSGAVVKNSRMGVSARTYQGESLIFWVE
jgi:hypothetical protein